MKKAIVVNSFYDGRSRKVGDILTLDRYRFETYLKAGHIEPFTTEKKMVKSPNELYLEKFGKEPHHRMSEETILKKIKE